MNSGDCVEENKMDIFVALCMSYLGNKWLRVTRPSTVKLHFVLCQQKRADGISSTRGYERSDCSSNHFHWHIQSSCLYKLLAAYIPERGLCLGKKCLSLWSPNKHRCCEFNYNTSRNFFSRNEIHLIDTWGSEWGLGWSGWNWGTLFWLD